MGKLLQARTDRAGKALVVDDDPIVRRFICSVLGFSGIDVLEAPDAAQALIAFQTGASAWVSSSLKFGCRDERLRSDANASRGASEPCGPAGLELDSGSTASLPFLQKPFTAARLLDALEWMPADDSWRLDVNGVDDWTPPRALRFQAKRNAGDFQGSSLAQSCLTEQLKGQYTR